MRCWSSSHHYSPACFFSRRTNGSIEPRGSQPIEKRMPRIPLDESHGPCIGVWENSFRAILMNDPLPALCDPINCLLPRNGTEFTGALGSCSQQGTSQAER